MDLIRLYIDTLLETSLIEPDEVLDFQGNTRIAGAWLQDDHILFRFESHQYQYGEPVCQYVILRDGKLIPRTDHGWFIPGDYLFENYKDAKRAASPVVIAV